MPTLTCPTCRRQVRYKDRSEVPDRPFCCERCRLVDLGKWFTEQYRISLPISPADLPPSPPAAADGEWTGRPYRPRDCRGSRETLRVKSAELGATSRSRNFKHRTPNS